MGSSAQHDLRHPVSGSSPHVEDVFLLYKTVLCPVYPRIYGACEVRAKRRPLHTKDCHDPMC